MSSSDEDSDPDDEIERSAATSVRVDSPIPDLSDASLVSTSPVNLGYEFGGRLQHCINHLRSPVQSSAKRRFTNFAVFSTTISVVTINQNLFLYYSCLDKSKSEQNLSLASSQNFSICTFTIVTFFVEQNRTKTLTTIRKYCCSSFLLLLSLDAET